MNNLDSSSCRLAAYLDSNSLSCCLLICPSEDLSELYVLLIVCLVDFMFDIVYYLFLRCEAFPTYPRTYDMVHAEGLLSLEAAQHHRCTTLDLFLEIDRILRPEVSFPSFSFVLHLCFIWFFHSS